MVPTTTTRDRRITVGDYELNYQNSNGAPALIPSAALERCLDFRHDLPCSPLEPSKLPRCALHLHAYYVEELFDLVDHLDGRIQGFDLLVTTDSRAKQEQLEAGLARRVQAAADCRWQVLMAGNRGRNLGPLLLDAWPLLLGYDCVLHMHSKRSEHLKLATAWRQSLVGNLIGSGELIRSIRTAFAVQPKLGLLVPQMCDSMRHTLNWGDNFPVAQMLWDQLHPDRRLRVDAPLVFPAGMMFWFRPAAIQSLQALFLRLQPLPMEPLALDGSPLHALERLVVHLCEAEGYDWRMICNVDHDSPASAPDQRLAAEPGFSMPLLTTVLTETYLQAASLLAARARRQDLDLELAYQENQMLQRAFVPRSKRLLKQLLRRALKMPPVEDDASRTSSP